MPENTGKIPQNDSASNSPICDTWKPLPAMAQALVDAARRRQGGEQ